AFVMVPPQGAATGARLELKSEATGSMDAVTRGTLEGAQLLLNIVAMLVVFVALVSLANYVLAPYTLQGILAWALAQLARLAGIWLRGRRRAGERARRRALQPREQRASARAAGHQLRPVPRYPLPPQPLPVEPRQAAVRGGLLPPGLALRPAGEDHRDRRRQG